MNLSAKFFLGLAAVVGTAQSAGSAEVIVQMGDTLSNIAQTHLGTSERWPELCELNEVALQGDCNLLLVGTTLALPGEAIEQAEAELPGAEVATISDVDNLDEPESDVTIIAGPVSLDDTWVFSGLTLNDAGLIESADSLLMAGVYDEQAQAWLARPVTYDAESGEFSLKFTTGPNTGVTRIYPLRNAAATAYAYKTIKGLSQNISYTATWKIQTQPAYNISDLVITRQ